mmetsp:Transcript_83715/g.223916  ORF Transcript_83715/g.223916 Transcript_83715/m.223916 type:complete len:230 (+) Transcript_83715:1377-2066(+)
MGLGPSGTGARCAGSWVDCNFRRLSRSWSSGPSGVSTRRRCWHSQVNLASPFGPWAQPNSCWNSLFPRCQAPIALAPSSLTTINSGPSSNDSVIDTRYRWPSPTSPSPSHFSVTNSQRSSQRRRKAKTFQGRGGEGGSTSRGSGSGVARLTDGVTSDLRCGVRAQSSGENDRPGVEFGLPLDNDGLRRLKKELLLPGASAGRGGGLVNAATATSISSSTAKGSMLVRTV